MVFSAFSAKPRATAIALSAVTPVICSCQAACKERHPRRPLRSAAKAAIKAVIGAKQVENSGDMRLAVGKGDTAYRHVAQQHIAALIVLREVLVQPAAEIGKRDRHRVVTTVDQAQSETHILAGLSVFGFQIPSAFGFALGRPAIADRALRHDQRAVVFRDSDRFPCGAIRLRCVRQDRFAAHNGPSPSVRHPAAAAPASACRCSGGIVLKVRHLPIEEELTQDHMAHRHGERRIGSLLGMKPKIGELGDFRIIRRDRHHLCAVVAGFNEEMGVGRPRLRHIRTPSDNVARNYTNRPIPERQSALPKSADSMAASRNTSRKTTRASRQSS